MMFGLLLLGITLLLIVLLDKIIYAQRTYVKRAAVFALSVGAVSVSLGVLSFTRALPYIGLITIVLNVTLAIIGLATSLRFSAVQYMVKVEAVLYILIQLGFTVVTFLGVKWFFAMFGLYVSSIINMLELLLILGTIVWIILAMVKPRQMPQTGMPYTNAGYRPPQGPPHQNHGYAPPQAPPHQTPPPTPGATPSPGTPPSDNA